MTEFGDWLKDPADAPDFMMRMMSLMGASGVSGTYWYTLLEEEYWPNMGLFTLKYEEQPAAGAFRFLQTTYLPLGRPLAHGKRGEDHIYEIGDPRVAPLWSGEFRRICM